MPLKVPVSRVPEVMFFFSDPWSRKSSGYALPRLTMSPTTPGCGIIAMSGVSLAWILVMISWLMLSTFCMLTVIPLALALATISFFSPAKTAGSVLDHTVTVLLSLLLPLPPPPQAATRAKEATAAAAIALRARKCRCIGFSSGLARLPRLA